MTTIPFCFLRDSAKTPEICLKAVKQNGWNLRDVPKTLRTRELCAEAVKRNGEALWFVPDELKTPELCRQAVEDDAVALGAVPDALKTEDLCQLAVACGEHPGHAFWYMPESMQTPELCLLAVGRDPRAYLTVPERFQRTWWMGLAFILSIGMAGVQQGGAVARKTSKKRRATRKAGMKSASPTEDAQARG